MNVIFWGSLLRVIQAVVEAAPTILVGLLVAGIFRRLLAHEGTQRLFGGGSWRGLLKAWAIGMLLPVCSLGVIPIAREMRKAGIAGGVILAFAMTAPLFNPLSLLYGLTLSEPLVILAFAMCSLLVVTVVGALWDRLFPNSSQPEDPPPAPVAHGWKRMLAVGVAAVRGLAGPTGVYLLVRLPGVSLRSAVLPAGALYVALHHGDPWAPLKMAAVAVPAFATPMLAMGQLGSMFAHANSVGAGFALLALGAGMNLGLIAWMFRGYGFAKSATWVAILFGVVIGLCYLVENPLHPHDVEPAGHSHAFDIYCAPFHHQASNPYGSFVTALQQSIRTDQLYAAGALGMVLLFGCVLRIADRRGRIEGWLERPPKPAPGRARKLDVNVPGQVVGGVALVGLVIFSILGCYAYYPPKDEAFADMSIINVTVVTSAMSDNRQEAEHFIPLMDDYTRRMQVGVYIREGELSRYQRMKARVYLDKLELLEHELAHDDDPEGIAKLANSVNLAYRRMRQAFMADQL